MIFIDIEMPNRCADCPCFKIIYGHDSCQLLHLIFNEDVYYGKHIHNPFESRYEDCPLRNASDFLKTIVDRPSEDLINRAEAIEALVKETEAEGAYGYTDITSIVHVISNLPSADRPKGKWIVRIIGGSKSDMIGDCIVACNQCGEEKLLRSGREKWNFCSNCGADMRGDETDESNN